MSWSWHLGRLFGIDTRVHASFLLVLLWAGLSSYGSGGTLVAALAGVVFMVAVFASVVAHELGHALTARQYGIHTRQILLLPIGGVAQLEQGRMRPRVELLVALAGPVVSFLLAGVLFTFTAVLGGDLSPNNFIANLAWTNLALAVFNMLPVFPMDGGRVLRAVLSLFTNRATATDAAATVGKVIAVGLFIFALLPPTNPFLMFLAVSVYMLGSQEAAYVRQREAWKRREHAWRNFDFNDSPRSNTRDGFVFDPVNRMWTEYRGGMAVRRFRDA